MRPHNVARSIRSPLLHCAVLSAGKRIIGLCVPNWLRLRLSIRAYLLAFSAAVLIPVVVFASVLLWRFAQSESTRYEQEARGAAQRLITAVDLELSKVQTAAEALATSPHLLTGDFQAFQQQALEALKV